jgi:hypothetical protein
MKNWDSVFYGVVVLLAALFGFGFGVRHERDAHAEWHKATDCPQGTWGYRSCVPVGCQMDLTNHQWSCK